MFMTLDNAHSAYSWIEITLQKYLSVFTCQEVATAFVVQQVTCTQSSG